MKIDQKIIDYLRDEAQAQLEQAKNHKALCHQECIELDYKGHFLDEYDCEDWEESESLKINYAASLQKALASQLTTAFLSGNELQISVEPTDEPNVPDYMWEEAAERLESLFLESEGGIPPVEDLERLIARSRNIVITELNQIGVRKTRNMERKIKDQLEHGMFRKAFVSAIQEASWAKCATVKGPYPAKIPSRDWDGNRPVDGLVDGLAFKHLYIWDVFPSPDNTDGKDGTYFWHAERHDIGTLEACKDSDHFITEEIEHLVLDVVGGEIRGCEPEDLTPEDREKQIDKLMKESGLDGIGDTLVGEKYENWFTDSINSGLFEEVSDSNDQRWWKQVEVMKGYTCIPTRTLKELDYKKKLEDKAFQEVEIWVVKDRVIYFKVDPYPAGCRPIQKVEICDHQGQYFGRSTSQVARPIQQFIYANYRAMLRNLAHSAEPVTTGIASMLAEGSENPPDELQERKIIWLDPEAAQSGRSPFTHHDVPFNAGNYMALVNEHRGILNTLLNIPSYLTGGQPNSSLRGVGVFNAHLEQSLKPIEAIIFEWDIQMIEPIIRCLFAWNMLYSEDDDIRFDAEVKARGAQSYLDKQARSQQKAFVIQQLSQMIQGRLVQAPGFENMVREWLDSVGEDADSILGSPELQQLNPNPVPQQPGLGLAQQSFGGVPA